MDGQPITDQQSKIFSNQLPTNAVQVKQVISGRAASRYGDKTSLVIDVTTRSGEGVLKPTGDIWRKPWLARSDQRQVLSISDTAGKTWGNFFEFDG